MTFNEFLSSSERKLSLSQMEVVNSNVATVVSAGAGSGKTTVLSYRFLRLVLEGRAHVDEILTLTFTKKAASEMYERIFNLLKSIEDNDDNIKAEMKRFASAYISTLDSFSNEIARTDCPRYGISKDFEVLDQDEFEELIENTVRGLFEKHKDDLLPLSLLFNPEDVSSQIFSKIADSITVLSDLDEEKEKLGFISFLDRIENFFYDYGIGVLNDIISLRTPGMNIKIFREDNENNIYNVLKALEEKRYSDLNDISLVGLKGEKYALIINAVKDRWRPICQTLISIAENRASDLSYFKAFSLFAKTVNSEKRRLGKLTFSDISDLALTILKENRDVRNYYKRKFKYIMIDEFQDNSEDQRNLLYILSEKEELNNLGVPLKEDLDNRKLFFVGDDKQSIYAFRGADVSVFNSLKDEMRAIGGVNLSMSENYRSEPELISFFNFAFPSILKKEDKPFSDLLNERFFLNEKGRSSSNYEAEYFGVLSRGEKVKSKIVFALSDELDAFFNGDESASSLKDSDDDFLNSAENEAEFIATYIKTIIESDDFLIPDKKGLRHATYDDIAILYRTSKSQLPLEKVLRREGIAYTVVSSNSITTEAISSDMLSFISLLIFPMDKESYLNVLRSPFVRLGDNSLYEIKDALLSEELIGEPFTHTAKLSKEEKEKMESVRAFYLDLKEQVGRLSAEKILDRLYYESGYSSYIESKLSLSPYKEHYEYLWHEAKSREDLFSFYKFLEKNNGSSLKFDVELLRLNEGGVRLLNIHKSKGLEFPIVILAGTNMERRAKDGGNLLISRNPELICLDLSIKKGLKDTFKSYKKRREDAENKRLLYVALTRAENHLVMIASGNKVKDGSFCSLLSETVINNGNVEKITFKSLKEDEIERKWESPNSFEAYYEKETVERGEYLHYGIGAKEFSHKNDENYGYDGSFPKLNDFKGGLDDILKDRGLYSDFGSYVHESLECYLNKVSIPNFKSNNLSDKELDVINKANLAIIDDFKSSSFYNTYLKGREFFTELRFYDSEGDILIEGSIDLLIEGDEYNLVIDYKTDREENPSYHRGQILSYIKAAESIYNKKCYGALLFLRNMKLTPFIDKSGNIIEL